MEGWISIYRKITEHPDYFSEPFTRMGAWIDLLILANHKDSYMRVRGVRVDIKRGQTAVSVETLERRWKWSRGKVRRYLEELENEGQIVRQKSNVISCISICKYEDYQTNGTTNDTADSTAGSTIDRTANNTASETTDSTADDTANGRQTVQQTDRKQDNRRYTNNNDNNVNNDNNNTHIDILSFKNSSRVRVRARECVEWISRNYPAVQQMPEPLTVEQAEWMVSKYAVEDIRRIVMAMDNKGATKNKSAYATFCAFAGSDEILKARKASGGKLYTYGEVADMVDMKKYTFDDFVMKEVDGHKLWAKVTALAQSGA